jgi:hypothetical protein
MTSLRREGAHDCSMARVKQLLRDHLEQLFALNLQTVEQESLFSTFHGQYPA